MWLIPIVVIGGGAAGLMAAATAAKTLGGGVLLMEKNANLGRKIRITGKGRCNLTNAQESLEEWIAAYPGNGRFLYSAFSTFSNQNLLDLFHQLGVSLKIERGGRVFPENDDANAVVTALTRYAKEAGVEIQTGRQVQKIQITPGGFGVVWSQGEIRAKKVILTTGGSSYPGTGSTGDGYEFARELGLEVSPILPSLVPLVSPAPFIPELSGLSLRNVSLRSYHKDRQIGEEFGEMLFTHFGLSGPVILRLSRDLAPLLKPWGKGTQVQIEIDLKPALSPEQLDKRLLRDWQEQANRQYANSLGALLPKSLIPVIVNLSQIGPEKPVHQITREERQGLVRLIKALPIPITSTRSLAEAIVTRGGVSVKEIHPRSMEAKRIPGLYLAGEVIDIDGYTGGYNLQAAFSTGFLAGESAAKSCQEI